MTVFLLFSCKLIFLILRFIVKLLNFQYHFSFSDKIDVMHILNPCLFCALKFETWQDRDFLNVSCGNLAIDLWRLLTVKQSVRNIFNLKIKFAFEFKFGKWFRKSCN